MCIMSAASDDLVSCVLELGSIGIVELASTDCDIALKPGHMSTNPTRCVGTPYLQGPRSPPFTDSQNVTDAELVPGPVKDTEEYSRSTHCPGAPQTRSLLDIALKESDATTPSERWLNSISESSCSDSETSSEGLTDGSSMASADSLDEICSPVIPPSPNLPPHSPFVDEGCHSMWSLEERLGPHSASDVTFSALGFVCPDLEPMPESLQDFLRQYHNGGDKAFARNALIVDC